MNEFIIDGYDIKEAFNIKVLSADGLDIVPKVKKRDEKSWPEESGVEIDTSTDLVFEAQDISLNCCVEEATYADGIKRINGLINKLADNGAHLLGSAIRNRLYPVLLQEISSYQRRTSTNASKVAITFTVKLICHMPECRMGSATVLAAGEVSLDAETDKQVTVWWGDGSSSTGTGLLEHSYTDAGTYTVLIAGTGVTASVFTTTGIDIDEYSYPASGDITHIDVSHTSEQTWQALEAHKVADGAHNKETLTGLKIIDNPEFSNTQITTLVSGEAITAIIASWLGATAKSVLSYIANISSKLYYSIYPQPQATSETGTFQLALTHLEIVTRVNSASDCLCNIPLNDTVAFPIGSVITIEQLGAGVVTATAISGVTLNGDPKTQGQYKFIQLWKTAINTWVVIGGTT